jgi:NADPH:quinone reductase-like Zn-dependent oxidoreductase
LPIIGELERQFRNADSSGLILEAGKIAPIIDRRYRLSDEAEALRYLAEGHARGKVVLTVQSGISA